MTTADTADLATREGEARSHVVDLPARLGRYHVLERLGSGGMSVVFTAYDPELDRKVALKLLRPDHGHESQVRLLREAQALARLSHPNVVQIHDAGAFERRIFLAMEFIRGVDLRAWLAAAPRGEAEVVDVFLQAGRGLAAAHAHGLVHRDFKPENVLVGQDGRICVADFGLARTGPEVAPPARGAAGALDLELTTTGALLGTPAYMSPEQHLGQPADAHSDQFSYCVALWEALCGQRPFAGDTAAAAAEAVIGGRVRAPPADRRVSRRRLDLMRRGLQVRPEQRFPDMPALLQALARGPARARRRYFAVAALSAMFIGTSYFLAAGGPAIEPCSGGESELAGVWDPARRAAVEATLADALDSSLPARVVAGLDARAAAWIAGHRDACLDQRRGEVSDALFDARIRCLGRRRQAIGRAVDLLTTPGTPDPPRLVARLPSAVPCADAGRDDSGAWVRDDPVLGRAADELESRLIAARALHHAGDEQAAHLAVQAISDRARRLELRPLLAESSLLHGQILMTLGDSARGREVLREAALYAIGSGRDELAAEALALQIFLDGRLGAPERGLADEPLARAIIDRLPAPGAALARLDNNIGTLAHNTGDFATARRYYERATAELLRTPEADPIELANYLSNLGSIADEPEVRRDAFARAVALLDRELGAGHLETLTMRTREASYEADLERGAVMLDPICPRFAALHPLSAASCAICFQRLGLAWAELDQAVPARAALRRVPACLRDEGRDPAQAEQFAVLRGRSAAALALLDGRPAEALAHADAALVRAEPHQKQWWVARDVAELRLARGRALLALERPQEAAATLAGALELLAELRPEQRDALALRWVTTAKALHRRAAGRAGE